MRKLLLFAAAFVVACGSGHKNENNNSVAGTIGGRAFTSPHAQAIPANAAQCTIPGVPAPFGIKGFALQFTSYADSCADYSGTTCKVHDSAQSVTVLYARLNMTGTGTEPDQLFGYPLPYTFAINTTATLPTQELSNNLPTGYGWVTYALALSTNATCAGTPAPVSTAGTLRIDSANASEITGFVSATFPGGDSIQGTFTAPICMGGAGPDVCGFAQTGGQICTTTTTTCGP